MDTALLVAKILGVYLVVSGFFMILRGKTLPRMLKDFADHPAIVYLTGVILIFLSTLYLLEKNVWDGTWRTLVTVLAWGTFLKGLTYLFAPQLIDTMVTKKMLKSVSIFGVVAIAAGVYLFFLG